ncbi:MAG: hypothetical protein QOK60_02600 [Nitrososphaeraceae archaeon]|nr:hypothetical protein [Nitrososphaeraceae archaeon]MDW0153419.1 hypothetical protein [Nitrososphaeraceae archaeon]
MKFEYEEFSTVEEFFLYLVSVAPYMKQVLPASSYKGYVFSILPLTPVSGDILMMIYAKGNMEPGLIEFDISTKKYKTVPAVERADKNYFIILTPKIATIADTAIKEIESLGKN